MTPARRRPIGCATSGLRDRTSATGEAHLQTAEQATALHELKDNFPRDTYQGTTISSFFTDLNRKLGFVKEHEPQRAAVGAARAQHSKEPEAAAKYNLKVAVPSPRHSRR